MLNTIIAGAIGGTEWIVILVVALLIFGGKKIPELMHGIGKGIRTFKEGMAGTDDQKNDVQPKNDV